MHDAVAERQEREFASIEASRGGQTMNPATLVTPTVRHSTAISIEHNRSSAVGTPDQRSETMETAMKIASLRAADRLSLAAAPTFAFMAALTGILGADAHEMLCSGESHTSALSGMASMYVLMSAFHLAPWLKLIARGRSGARAAGLMHEGSM
jgi:hypothetical protein